MGNMSCRARQKMRYISIVQLPIPLTFVRVCRISSFPMCVVASSSMYPCMTFVERSNMYVYFWFDTPVDSTSDGGFFMNLCGVMLFLNRDLNLSDMVRAACLDSCWLMMQLIRN